MAHVWPERFGFLDALMESKLKVAESPELWTNYNRFFVVPGNYLEPCWPIIYRHD